PLRRLAVADAAVPQDPILPTLLHGRAQDRRRPRADRGGGGGIRRRLRGPGCRPRLPAAGIAVPAQHPAAVRSAAAADRDRRRHLRPDLAGRLALPPPLARERHPPGELRVATDLRKWRKIPSPTLPTKGSVWCRTTAR